jgi:hypothetical protein
LNKLKLFLDFDETLFNHYAYLDWADGFLKRFSVAPGSFGKEREAFHIQLGENLRLYKHKEHMEATAGKDWSFISGEIELELKHNQHDFCYPEVHEFLKSVVDDPKFEVRILTYGNGEYQRYKLKTCRLITQLNIPVHVVDSPKGQFLGQHFGDAKGILIDDKYPLNLPPSWTHMFIDRKSKQSQPEFVDSKTVIKISELTQFAQAYTLMNSR